MVMEGYTPSQAAAITGLKLAAIHKAIDQRLIRPRKSRSRRLLSKEQVLYLQLEAEGLRLLPVSTRRSIAQAVIQNPGRDQLTVGAGGALIVEVRRARRKVERELKHLARLEAMAVSDPGIMGGTPVFRGTRIPVDLIADMLAQGATIEDLLEGYPSLTRQRIAMAPLYMRAFPRRGRPARRRSRNGKVIAVAGTSLTSLLGQV